MPQLQLDRTFRNSLPKARLGTELRGARQVGPFSRGAARVPSYRYDHALAPKPEFAMDRLHGSSGECFSILPRLSVTSPLPSRQLGDRQKAHNLAYLGSARDLASRNVV